MRYVTLSKFERAMRALDGTGKGKRVPVLLIFGLIVFFQFASSAYNFVVRQSEAFSTPSAASEVVITEARVARVKDYCRSTFTNPDTGKTRRVRGCSRAERLIARYGSDNVTVRRRTRYKVRYQTPSGPVERWLKRRETGGRKLRVGDRVEVKYDPEKPKSAVRDSDLKWLVWLPLIIISMLVTPIGLILAWGVLSWLARQNKQEAVTTPYESIPAAADRGQPVTENMTEKLKRQMRDKLRFPDRTGDSRYAQRSVAQPARREPPRQSQRRSSTVQRQRGLTDLFT